MKLKKIICLYPYEKILPYYEFFPPVGIEYIAAAVRDLAEEVCLVDMRCEKNLPGIVAGGADMFCVSVGWHYDVEDVYKVIRSLPEDVMTVAGGKYATENVEALFAACPNIDVIVRGDGEDTIRELITNGSPVDVPGLSYRRSGAIVHNPNRTLGPVNNDLFPDRTLRRYAYDIGYRKSRIGVGFDAISSSRGCPFHCKFCSFNFNPLGQKRSWSPRTPRSVINELRETTAKIVMFIDENFFADIRRAEEICDLIVKEKLQRIFVGQARATIGFHPELIRKMHAAGFRVIFVGIESTQDKTLKQLHKGFTIAEVRKSFEVLRRSGMFIHAYFIIGNIGETEEEMMQIVPFARELGVDTIALSRLRYEKYSAMADLLAGNPDYYVDERDCIVSRAYSGTEIKRIRRKIGREFYSAGHILSLFLKAVRIKCPPWPYVWRFICAYIKEDVLSPERKREQTRVRKADLVRQKAR
jgi:magnesium-protoporphyrin IX monomethyl ester (oxidative) cyclase